MIIKIMWNINIVAEKKSVGKIKMPTPSTPTTTPRLIELRRDTLIKHTENGELKQYTVQFDELEAGDLLGRGQFGTVKRMFHKPSNLTFAVKVISKNKKTFFLNI